MKAIAMIKERLFPIFLCVFVTSILCSRAVIAETPIELQVKLIDQVEIPARQTGVIAKLHVRVGQHVTRGELVGQLDDQQAGIALQLAKTRQEIAKAIAQNFHQQDLAEKDLLQQKQLQEQQQLKSDIADQKAASQIRVSAAKKAEEVAKNELERATRARQEFIDSVSRSEIDALKLAYQRLHLEAQQAVFDRELDLLNAASEDRADAVQQLKVKQSEVALKQSISDKQIADLEAQVGQHNLRLAELQLDQHQVVSPIDGVIAQQYRRVGEWVRAGEPLIRVIRLDRLKAEGYIQASQAQKLRDTTSVGLRVEVDGKVIPRTGTVAFVSPEVDPVSGEVMFSIEFDNPNQQILPGMRMRLTGLR